LKEVIRLKPIVSLFFIVFGISYIIIYLWEERKRK